MGNQIKNKNFDCSRHVYNISYKDLHAFYLSNLFLLVLIDILTVMNIHIGLIQKSKIIFMMKLDILLN